MRALARWLRRHRDRIDVVCVSMLKHDAHAAVGALRKTKVPIVLRAEGAGRTGDCRWQQTANFGRRIGQRCLLADAFVAPAENIEVELAEAGYPSQRIVRIPNGVSVGPLRDATRQAKAREALAEIGHELALPRDAPLAVYVGRLHQAKGLRHLAAAFKKIVARRSNARLWLVGHGPDRGALIDRVHDLDLRGRIVLPGVFDDVEELLHAADVFVLPSHEEGMSISLLEAMAAGVPVVTTDIPGNRPLVTDGQHGLLVPPGDVPALAEAIARVLDEPETATRLAAAARRRVEEHFTLAQTVAAHEELFSRLTAEKRSFTS